MSSTNEFFLRNAARCFRILCDKRDEDGSGGAPWNVVLVVVVSDALAFWLSAAGGFSSYVCSELLPDESSCLIANPSTFSLAWWLSAIALHVAACFSLGLADMAWSVCRGGFSSVRRCLRTFSTVSSKSQKLARRQLAVNLASQSKRGTATSTDWLN